MVLLFIDICMHVFLETNLNVKIGSGTCMHNFISAHWLCARFGINRGLDQTTKGCASNLGPARLLHSDQGIHAAVTFVLFFQDAE